MMCQIRDLGVGRTVFTYGNKDQEHGDNKRR